MSETPEIGVIVGRFQIDRPHSGHSQIINEVLSKHCKVIMFLGVSPDTGNPNDPMDFHTRKLMIEEFIKDNHKEKFNDIIILPIKDMWNNLDWSMQLDELVDNSYPFKRGVLLYGGRDSFIKHYEGKFKTQEIKPDLMTAGISATSRRQQLPRQILANEDYRKGIISRSMNEWPRTDMCADLAVVNEDRTEVLMGRKFHEKEVWRFIGGHFDTKLDTDTEMTARREGSEELGGVEIITHGFIGNYVVPSWRRRGSPNVIMTNFYEGTIQFGNPRPSDDIYEIMWWDINDLNSKFEIKVNAEHKILWKAFYNYIKINYSEIKTVQG